MCDKRARICARFFFVGNRRATRGRKALKLRSREVGAFFEGTLQKAVVTTVWVILYIHIYAHNRYIRVHVHINIVIAVKTHIIYYH